MFQPEDFLSEQQRSLLKHYETLLIETNSRINLISRQMNPADCYERHILHCLSLTERPFPDQAEVVDFGTGGGLPGLVLAICFPKVHFHLIDSTGKKIRAVQEMSRTLGLDNVSAYALRAETWTGKAHYAVSRATAPLKDLWFWFNRVRIPFSAPVVAWQPGLLCLKGGNLTEEVAQLRRRFPRILVRQTPLTEVLRRPYFEEKVRMTIEALP
ncbi:MAG: 16S rRNA (guanine(527)-N(7))-methyltransferase RsmG [Bacteroidetes Order II. Incertae sedis bacterium]|nr:16S rRNA (guanine(527)-N(7))-methyltransferase RsmG [Bacteroidetes Order II. bacterium]